MLDLLNSIACATLLVMLWPVAFIIHSWRATLVMLPVSIALGLQALNPLGHWLSGVVWTQTMVNVALAIVVVLFRKELWAMIRYKVGHDGVTHYRRTEDIHRALTESYGGTQ